VRSAILDSAMTPVVIILLDPTSDAGTRFFHAAGSRSGKHAHVPVSEEHTVNRCRRVSRWV